MKEITILNDAPKQTFKFTIDGYDYVEVYIEFKPQQYSWFFNLTWGNFSLFGERVAVSPNLLRQFKDLIPFGIMISGEDGLDPFAIDSWVTKNKFYFLSADEVLTIESDTYGAA